MRALLVMAALLWGCTDGNPDSGYRDGEGGQGGGGAAGQGGEGGEGGTGGTAGEGGAGGEGGALEPDAAPVDAAPPVDAEIEPGWTADGRWIGWPAAPEGSERNSDNVLCHPRCGCSSATLGIPGAIDEPYEVETGTIHDFPLHVRFGTCGPMPGVEVIPGIVRVNPQGASTAGTRITAPNTDADGDTVLTLEAGVPVEFWLQAHLDVPGVELLRPIRIVPAAR